MGKVQNSGHKYCIGKIRRIERKTKPKSMTELILEISKTMVMKNKKRCIWKSEKKCKKPKKVDQSQVHRHQSIPQTKKVNLKKNPWKEICSSKACLKN